MLKYRQLFIYAYWLFQIFCLMRDTCVREDDVCAKETCKTEVHSVIYPCCMYDV